MNTQSIFASGLIGLSASFSHAAIWEVSPPNNIYFPLLIGDNTDPFVPYAEYASLTSRLTKLAHDLVQGTYDSNNPPIPLVQIQMIACVPQDPRGILPFMTTTDYTTVVFDDGSLWFPGTLRVDAMGVLFSYYNDETGQITNFANFGWDVNNPIDPAQIPSSQITFDLGNFYLTKDGGYGRATFDGQNMHIDPLQNPSSLPNFSEYVAAHVPAPSSILPLAMLAFAANRRRR
jgi:hypothetical protein